mmetsp:Transcript_66495/g.163929  ORF Transcript_66495/g.163929 Transcript_66495/m.163929 type:complete len:223 (+) Transcript_66495:100-768(+)
MTLYRLSCPWMTRRISRELTLDSRPMTSSPSGIVTLTSSPLRMRSPEQYMMPLAEYTLCSPGIRPLLFFSGVGGGRAGAAAGGSLPSRFPRDGGFAREDVTGALPAGGRSTAGATLAAGALPMALGRGMGALWCCTNLVPLPSLSRRQSRSLSRSSRISTTLPSSSMSLFRMLLCELGTVASASRRARVLRFSRIWIPAPLLLAISSFRRSSSSRHSLRSRF